MLNTSDLPLVCICIPTFNAEKTIRETLVSIVNQSYLNLDIFIVDNASTDTTLKIVNDFKDARIKIYRYEINVGGEENFNRCIKLASGKYTAIFHADDIYESEMVEKQVEFLEENSTVGAVSTEANKINEYSNFIGKVNFTGDFISYIKLYDFKSLLKAVLRHSNFLICPSVMVRTDIYKTQIRRWRGELFFSSADLDVWFRIAQFHQVAIITKPLMRYRISSTQGSAMVRLQTGRADFFYVIDYYLEKNYVRTLLTKLDLNNYAALERRDIVVRAINFFLKGETGAVLKLLNEIELFDVLSSSIQGKRGACVLAVFIYLHILLFLKLNKFGQVTLKFMKHAMLK